MENFTLEKKIKFKQALKKECEAILLKRIETATEAILQAQDSANSETKSSMGDKYETSRAMGQLDADMNAKQLKEAENELNSLKLLNVDSVYSSVVPGSVVMFEKTTLFIASGLGTIKSDERDIITLSIKSPLYNLLKHKIIGDTFVFQNKERVIELIF